MLVGYVRAGSLDWNPGRQLEELKALPAVRAFMDKLSGKSLMRPQFWIEFERSMIKRRQMKGIELAKRAWHLYQTTKNGF